MKRDSIFSWISLTGLRNIYGALIGVDNKLRYSSQLIFDNDLDIPDLGTVKNILGSGINSNIFTEADLVDDGFGGFILPYSLADGEVIIGIRIDPDTGDASMLTPSYDFVNNAITGFPNDDPQSIKIFATGVYSPPIPTPLPVFTLQPQTPVTVIFTKTLSLAASASNTTSYQWYKNGVAISGETNNTLNIPFYSPADAGTYYVIANGPGGFTQSNNSVVSFDYGIYLFNNSNKKSDNTPNGSGRDITFNDGVNSGTIPANSFDIISSSVVTLVITQGGSDSLTLKDGSATVFIPIAGGNVANNYNAPFVGQLEVYNNN